MYKSSVQDLHKKSCLNVVRFPISGGISPDNLFVPFFQTKGWYWLSIRNVSNIREMSRMIPCF